MSSTTLENQPKSSGPHCGANTLESHPKLTAADVAQALLPAASALLPTHWRNPHPRTLSFQSLPRPGAFQHPRTTLYRLWGGASACTASPAFSLQSLRRPRRLPTPSNVKDDAAGKSFTFIPIFAPPRGLPTPSKVTRNLTAADVAQALLPAASALLPTHWRNPHRRALSFQSLPRRGAFQHPRKSC